MKKIFFITMGLLALTACQESLTTPAEYDIRISAEETTMFAGDPVKFTIEGDIDNLVFYSGEAGHKYVYRDRYTVAMEDVKKADLGLKMMSQYGLPQGMDIFVSNSFGGLKGNDAEADRATVKAMVDGNMSGWTKITYPEPETGTRTITDIDLPVSDYLDNFCLAFHWKPDNVDDQALRTYAANGTVSLDLGDAGATDIDLAALDFVALQMDEKAPDPYKIPSGNGRVILNDPKQGAIFFKGAKKGTIAWDPEAWVISKPRPMNSVSPDKGEVVKNLQNTLESFTHVYEQAGEYEATFVGVNASIDGSSKKIITKKIIVLDRPLE